MLGCVSASLLGCPSSASKLLRGGRTQSMIRVPANVLWWETVGSLINTVVSNFLCVDTTGNHWELGKVVWRSLILLLTRQEKEMAETQMSAKYILECWVFKEDGQVKAFSKRFRHFSLSSFWWMPSLSMILDKGDSPCLYKLHYLMVNVIT